MRNLIIYMNKHKKTLLNILLFKLLLDLSYLFYVQKRYDYYGFILDFNLIKEIESIIFIILIFFCISKINNKYSKFIISLLYILSIMPIFTLYSFENQSRLFTYSIFIGFFITTLMARYPIKSLIKFSGPKKCNSSVLKQRYNNIFMLILFLFSLATYTLLIYYNGIPTFKAFNLSKVYEIRSSNRMPRYVNYMFFWQSKVINPFLLGLFILKRNKLMSLLIIILQISLFLITAHKIVLFSMILVVSTIIILKFKSVLNILLSSFNIVVSFSFFLYIINISEWPASLFIRRLLFAASQNGYYYYEYYSNNKLVFLSHSVLKRFIEYPYNLLPTYNIGAEYYDNPKTSANAGYLADAYMNFGITGVILFSIILGIILIFINLLSETINSTIIATATILGFFSLNDSALLTSLMTNGIILGILLSVSAKFLISNRKLPT